MSNKPTILQTDLRFNGTLIPLQRNRITKLVQHHMASQTWDINQVHAFHRDSNRWAGIGYNWWIAFDGTIYQGRGWHVGAHVSGFNSTTLGIGYQGDFTKQAMTEAQVEAGAALNAWLMSECPNVRSVADIIGHRDLAPTICPGPNFRMDDLKNTVNQPNVQNPVVTPTPPKTGGAQVVTTPIIRRGSNGAAVGRMQNRLMTHGYSLPRFGADNDFGAETENAVRAFQRDKGLTVDGIVGPKTWAELNKVPSNQPKYSRLLRIASPMMRGEDVRAVQRKVGVNADGIYGPQTERAVRSYQATHKLAVDGMVGSQTWAHMFR
ncbi:putative N-acetylmuramoyl-L-alanine amidase [Bacillus sp. TS-2]|nr:putative N-acetylmuramoyl-L-alanine amidase [Bacillus sp. TS-2]